MNIKQPSRLTPLIVLLVSLLSIIASPVASFAQPINAPTVSIDQLQPGMKGEVWTVFKGNTPEAFSVQVTGILRNTLGPGKSLILCELTDSRVQLMGAVAGMSGSPLYIDGKLAGVLSYQIQRFETVRYAGFTPISDMLEISSMPSDAKGGTPPEPIPVHGNRNTRASDFSPNAQFTPMTPTFSVGGLAPNVAAALEPQFSALGLSINGLGGNSAGSDNENTPVPPGTALHPGGVVAVALAIGDVTIAGTGTVSHVDGNRILAFGHPMMSLGATELPMASAEIVTILPSQLNSIKVSNTGNIIGSFSQDRLSGIYGEIGRKPQMVPVEVNFPGRMNRKALHFQVVRHEQVLPMIAATGLAQAVMGSNESGFARGFKVKTTVEFPGIAPVELTQIYSGPQGFNQGLGEFVGMLSMWLFNPYERVFPERIRFSVEDTPETPQGVVEQMQMSRSDASPGEHVDFTVGWRGFQRVAEGATLGLDIPADWAGKDLEVILTTGPALDELTGRSHNVQVSQLRSFNEYLTALREFRSTDGLYLAVVEKSHIFTDQRHATQDLPGSFERIAHDADETRFQQRDIVTPLWEKQLLPGRLFTVQVRKPLNITD